MQALTLYTVGDRFGNRWRPYTAHQAKVLGRSMIAEIKSIWADDLAKTAGRPFRGLSENNGDAYLVFIYAQYVVHLELLLKLQFTLMLPHTYFVRSG